MATRRFDIPFHKSLFFTIGGLFIVFVAITVSLQYIQEKNIRQDNLNSVLQEHNQYVAQLLPDSVITDNDSILRVFSHYPYRLTLIDITSGKVILDNSTDAQIESPHLNRPEIKAAIEGKSKAYSIRYSETMHNTYFYAAMRDGNYIIRSSMPYDERISSILHVDPWFRYILMGIALLFVLALFLFCYRLGKSISELDELAQIAEQNRPLQFKPTASGTLNRITHNLRKTYEALRMAREALALEEEKLLAHIQTSREGIAIFKHNKQMIVSNNLFIQYMNHITDKTIDNDLSLIFSEPTLREVTNFVAQPYNHFTHKGNAAIKQIRINKNGMLFVIKGILFHDNSFEISIFDNTEREREDLLKKQLTQNSAHELKTPVSSIRGYLETILTMPTIDADKQRLFIERSYAQARRLSDLLNDISMLNRLDETSDIFDRQDLDLAHIIRDAIAESATALENKSMQITTQGISSSMPLVGNHSLLYSIFRNLIDNAIAYAGEGTKILIDCYLVDNKYYYISFADNGVGVEEAHLQRLFERFYRVDKGRSRKLGGTGLGLAIVKNAVLFHNGEIMAKNAQGGGLDILFTLRKA